MGSLEEYESYERKIERGLILWLREVHGVSAVKAEASEAEVERGWSTGCETCGYGADEDTVYFYVKYREVDDDDSWYWKSVKVEGTNVNFLPTILPYIDRAN